METTANVGQPLSADVGNNIAADLVPDLNPEEDDPEDNNTLVTMATTLPTTSPTTRKWGSAISPDVLFRVSPPLLYPRGLLVQHSEKNSHQ
ncbi:hypothetical protein PSTG_14762 [Puccinia striiformis f. sp. tritici PST-78]|uniref:Uncharacterized protein n=1 Tax=Puccinia striiformis f. sp. tritici PST-78 TaxID=1165861 RepID=A0A0L0UYG7_9BASI|nr:hypothetical protein PSTG_14762 [Puccinia striiformis f. sp. tritici PST-78]